MKTRFLLASLFAFALFFALSSQASALLPQTDMHLHAITAGAQQLAFAGLRSSNQQGQFNAIQRDPSGNLYLLMNQGDGVRIFKFNASATNLLAQSPVLGTKGDIGLAMALDASGNVYVTGTTSSGALAASGNARFNSYSGSSITSFVAGYTSSLTPIFVTFTGGARMTASAIAVSSDAVYITGSIFAATLPVTNNSILQAPPPNTMQNGFVEKFSLDGASLLYATYLGGQNGYTAPAAIAVDAADDAYVAGYTTATGYPTVKALIPELIDTPSVNGPVQQSGFLTKLTPAGDGLTFSTFLSGSGITAIALDATDSSLYLAGGLAPGQFPVTSFASPIVPAQYQGIVKIAADGSSVIYATALVPSNNSVLSVDSTGNVWASGQLAGFLFPQTPLADIGNAFALHMDSQGDVDQTVRLGGLPTTDPSYYAASTYPTSIATDTSGNALLAGSFQILSAASPTPPVLYDLALLNTPTAALPSTVSDLVPTTATCGSGSQCIGSGGYLEKISTQDGAALALSTHTLPNLTLRNLGSSDANGVQITASGYTAATNCGSTVTTGSECSIALTGSGPGSLTIQSSSTSQPYTINLPANTNHLSPDAVVFSPKEIDFGVVSSVSAPATRTITVTNLTTQSQSFTSLLDQNAPTTAGYSLYESTSDCTAGATANTKVLAPNASCTVTLGFKASTNPQEDGFVQALWKIGNRDVLLTGYTQAAGLSLSSSELDFGTQIVGGLRLPRYLYLSNNTDAAIAHASLSLPSSSPFIVTDRCPSSLLPGTVCQVEVDYLASKAPSADSTVLNVDSTLSVLLTGQTLPQPTVNGATPNPNLSVTPTQIVFADPVTVTTTSGIKETVQIQNTGSNAFALTLAVTGDFNITGNTCGASLAGGATCSVSVNFAPSQPGLRQGLISITASGGSAAYVNLSGTGTGIVPANNGTVDFGWIPIGQPAVQWIKISLPLTSLTASTTSPYGVVLVEDQGFGHGQPSAAAFQSSVTGSCNNCWLGVQFQPMSAGTQAGAVQLSTVAGGNPYLLSLTGTGIPLTTTYLTPASTDFGPVFQRSSSAPYSFTLINGSTQSATVNTPVLTGDFSLKSDACPTTLPAGDSCTLQITFAPTATGPRDGSISIQTSIATATSTLTGYGSPDPGVAFNPSGLVFNNVSDPSATLQSITVTNTATSGTLQIGAPTTSSNQFAATSQCTQLAPAASCTLQVRYTPSSALVTGTLQVPVTSGGTTTTYTIPLSTTYTAEDAGLTITPSAMDYGPIATETPGGVRLFTVSNLTSKPITLSLDLPRQFALASAPCGGLAPHASCVFAVQFVPLTNGPVTGSILALGDPGDNSGVLNGIAYLQGYGDGGGSLAISGNFQPTVVLDFGLVASGQINKQTLTLTNKGQGALNLRRITSEPPFGSVTNCGSVLAVNASCTVTLTFSPIYQYATGTSQPNPQTMTGALVIESDSITGPDYVNLSGTASATSASTPSNSNPLVSFSLSQNSLVFPAASVGNSTTTQPVTISNTGAAVIHVSTLQTTPDFKIDNGNCLTPLSPGTSCTFSVAFTPQSAGQRIGAVEISSDNSTALEFVSLLGTGQPAALQITPPSLNFGTVNIGSGTSLPVQVTNTTSSAVTFNNLAITGDYAVSGDCPNAGSTFAVGASCTLQVVFTPTQAGTRTGVLSIATSATTQPLTVSLNGNGAQAQLQVSSPVLNFGSETLGQSTIQTLTLTNSGTAPILNLVATTTGDYTVTTGCATSTLAPGATCVLTIVFTPTTTGFRSGILTISSNDPKSPATVLLNGTGVQSGSFTLTIASGSSPTETVQSGQPAAYTLAVTPVGGYQGVVTLGCAPQSNVPYALCAALPVSVSLSGSTVNDTVTIDTVTEVKQAAQANGLKQTLVVCFLFPAGMIFVLRRRLPRSMLWIAIATIALITAQGCGSGGDPYLRFVAPGTYTFQATATSTNGIQLSQSVPLTLVVK
ncbi:MAG: choice-of-anchor D domain-containing protein [Acidobacteriaceae bacterium]